MSTILKRPKTQAPKIGAVNYAAPTNELSGSPAPTAPGQVMAGNAAPFKEGQIEADSALSQANQTAMAEGIAAETERSQKNSQLEQDLMNAFSDLRKQAVTRRGQAEDALSQFFERQKAITGLQDPLIQKLKGKALKRTARAFEGAGEAINAEEGSRASQMARTRASQEGQLEQIGKQAQAEALLQGLSRNQAAVQSALARSAAARGFNEELGQAKYLFDKEFDESLKNTFLNSITALKNTGLDNNEDIARMTLSLRNMRASGLFGR